MTNLTGITAEIDTSEGSMKFEFFPDKAPGHVDNFVSLAEKGFYEGTVFHRVISGFMIQGGCPLGTGTGDAGYKIKAEFNETHHERGVLSMARGPSDDSAGSQFFVCHGEAGFLDGQYTAFGRLIEGDDTLDKIASAPIQPGGGGENSKPVSPVRVSKVTISRGE
ncbi:MAG: peptidylprolyl isomerase [Planctomycetes bacterium]|jgi:peptidyl-prolyl cis-trans isomerase B (cyclophilin B)|nr:peptidylprolyl isomerase [Planctomycetota bacterium]